MSNPDPASVRRYLAADADLGDAAVVESSFRELETRRVESKDALEQWLLDWSELDSWLDEEGSQRYVNMTCHTDDAALEKRYLDFIESVEPLSRSWEHKLDKKLLASVHRSDLPNDRYGILWRQVEARTAIFREENIPLHTEDDKLRQQYQKLIGGMTLQHDGREQTMQQMGRYLEGTERAVRQEAGEKIAAKWAESREEIERIYDEMIRVRHRIGLNAGFASYRDFMFKEMQRFDYTPGDCEAFANSIAEIVVPAARQLAETRKRQLGVDRLRPWDMQVDPEGRSPLAPFESEAQLVAAAEKVFDKVNPLFGEQFRRMQRERLLDLESRKGKAPGGYMNMFQGRRLPFIFMNAVGTQRDVETLLHEGGHAFHSFAASAEPLLELREAPIEFSEVASMAMELLSLPWLNAFYSEQDHRRAQADHLDGIVRFFPYMATIDQLQHWVYAHPNHTREDRRIAWSALVDRFGGWIDYTGYESARDFDWHRKQHPFTVPFYYVEYGIAQLGALGVWLNSQRDYARAVQQYRSGLALGGTKPLPRLFEAAGVKFDFSARAIEPITREMMRRIA
ncbi:MAG TPA: M3 family oligoendopeptidase [Phycisphaerae bacterium]|nr:M3 family oligoendopeptidase [Phycisphaerae bacterium]